MEQKVLSNGVEVPAQIMLRYLLQQDIVIIPKSAHTERIQENTDVFDFTLTAEEMAELKKLDTGIPMIGNAEDPEGVESAAKW